MSKLIYHFVVHLFDNNGVNMKENLQKTIKITIVECHQGTIDGYTYRFQSYPDIKIISTSLFADELDNQIIMNTNVLITGLNVFSSKSNHNPIPVFFYIKSIKKINPKIKVIIIAEFVDKQLINNYLQAGIDGLISKNDQQAIVRLGEIVELINKNGMYISGEFKSNYFAKGISGKLTLRQLEVLSLCAAFPDEGSTTLAKRLNISSSTFRNILSLIYEKLEVRTRAGAILKAGQLGLIQTNSSNDFEQPSYISDDFMLKREK